MKSSVEIFSDSVGNKISNKIINKNLCYRIKLQSFAYLCNGKKNKIRKIVVWYHKMASKHKCALLCTWRIGCCVYMGEFNRYANRVRSINLFYYFVSHFVSALIEKQCNCTRFQTFNQFTMWTDAFVISYTRTLLLYLHVLVYVPYVQYNGGKYK